MAGLLIQSAPRRTPTWKFGRLIMRRQPFSRFMESPSPSNAPEAEPNELVPLQPVVRAEGVRPRPMSTRHPAAPIQDFARAQLTND